MIGIADIFPNMPGTFVVLLTAANDHFLKVCVIFIGLLRRGLKQSLGEVAQMNYKAVEIQRLPVKSFLVEVFHHFQRALDQFGDVIHDAHAGIQFRVDNMQGNKGRFTGIQIHLCFLLNDPQAMLAQVVFRGIVTHNVAFKGIGKLHTLLFALDGEADVVRQGNEQGLVERRGNLALDIFDQVLCQLQVFNWDLFAQFP